MNHDSCEPIVSESCPKIHTPKKAPRKYMEVVMVYDKFEFAEQGRLKELLIE